MQPRGELGRRRRRHVQPLHDDAAPDVAVVAQVVGQRQLDEPVHHLAVHDPRDEIRLLHVEVAVVVRDRGAGGAVGDDDRVVAETFEEDRSRLHRDHADPQRRGRRPGEAQQQRQHRAGDAPVNPGHAR